MKKYYIITITIVLILILDYGFNLFLLNGLNRAYKLNQHSKILVIGHSHIMMGLDRATMEQELECPITKYTRSGVGLIERHLMVKQYLNSQYSDSLKLAVLGVDPFSFNGTGISKNSYTLFYPFMDDPDVSTYLKKNTSPLEYGIHKTFKLTRYSDDLLTASIRGWKSDDRNYKSDTLTTEIMERRLNVWMRDIEFNPILQNELEMCIKELTQRGIRVLLINTPIVYKLTQSQNEKYKKILDYYQNLEKKFDLVDFINYSPKYEHNFSLFFDPIHLNKYGQNIITQLVIEDIKKRNLLQ